MVPTSPTHWHISCWDAYGIQWPNPKDRKQLCDVAAFAFRAGEWWFLLAWSEKFLKRTITLFTTKFVNWHFALLIKTEPQCRYFRHPVRIKRVTGLEPAALSLGSWCSTTELHPPGKLLNYTYWFVLLSRNFNAGYTIDRASSSNFLCLQCLIYTAWICPFELSRLELG